MKKIKILTPEDVNEAADLMKQGELVAFPTETVYGLGAPLLAPKTIEKIFEAKKRPSNNPLIAHIAHLDQVAEIGQNIPPVFYTLAKAFFPGPLTLVIEKKSHVPLIATANLNTIAVRMPSHPVARALIEAVGQPLVAPSANLSGRPSSTQASHVVNDFHETIAAVIDGGPCTWGMESTVVDCVNFERPTLLRLGSLKKEEIEAFLGHEVPLYSKGPKSSPGMQYRHYAPKAAVRVFDMKSDFEQYMATQAKVFALGVVEAHSLYASLRLADEEGYDQIALCIEGCEDQTLLNRLQKITELHSTAQ